MSLWLGQAQLEGNELGDTTHPGFSHKSLSPNLALTLASHPLGRVGTSDPNGHRLYLGNKSWRGKGITSSGLGSR